MHKIIFILVLLVLVNGCTEPPAARPTSTATQVGERYESEVLQHPDWSRDAAFYYANIRQHTEEGTLAALQKALPEMRTLGAEAIVLSPVFEVGERNRRGTFGDALAVRNYRSIAPPLGTLPDLVQLVRRAHSLNMRVLLDWPLSYVSADHDWLDTMRYCFLTDTLDALIHPMQPPREDLAELNYTNDTTLIAMMSDMQFWLDQAQIDGFSFRQSRSLESAQWKRIRAELDPSGQSLLLMTDDADPEWHYESVDASKAATFDDLLEDVVSGRRQPGAIDDWVIRERDQYIKTAYRILALSGLRENALNGTVADRFGKSQRVAATLSCTLHGAPLLYTGQEVGNTQALSLYEKDSLIAGDTSLEMLYSKLLETKQKEPALWNGFKGGAYERLITYSDDDIFCFRRFRDDSEVIVAVNFSDRSIPLKLKTPLQHTYQSIFNPQVLSSFTNGAFSLQPHGVQVFVKQAQSFSDAGNS
jgi:glycosidase